MNTAPHDAKCPRVAGFLALSSGRSCTTTGPIRYHANMPPLVRRQLPNALTVLRIILAGAFFATLNAYRYPDHNELWANMAIVLFIAAVVTDVLDGHLARKWHVESVFGRLMDPFCDKVLIIGAFIYLSGPRFVIAEAKTDEGDIVVTMATAIYPWMVVVILAREILVTGIRGVIESMGVSGASLWSGKVKMILQSAIIPIVLALVVNFPPADQFWVWMICTVLVYATIVVTVWSGLPYIIGLRKVLALSAKSDQPLKADGEMQSRDGDQVNHTTPHAQPPRT